MASTQRLEDVLHEIAAIPPNPPISSLNAINESRPLSRKISTKEAKSRRARIREAMRLCLGFQLDLQIPDVKNIDSKSMSSILFAGANVYAYLLNSAGDDSEFIQAVQLLGGMFGNRFQSAEDLQTFYNGAMTRCPRLTELVVLGWSFLVVDGARWKVVGDEAYSDLGTNMIQGGDFASQETYNNNIDILLATILSESHSLNIFFDSLLPSLDRQSSLLTPELVDATTFHPIYLFNAKHLNPFSLPQSLPVIPEGMDGEETDDVEEGKPLEEDKIGSEKGMFGYWEKAKWRMMDGEDDVDPRDVALPEMEEDEISHDKYEAADIWWVCEGVADHGRHAGTNGQVYRCDCGMGRWVGPSTMTSPFPGHIDWPTPPNDQNCDSEHGDDDKDDDDPDGKDEAAGEEDVYRLRDKKEMEFGEGSRERDSRFCNSWLFGFLAYLSPLGRIFSSAHPASVVELLNSKAQFGRYVIPSESGVLNAKDSNNGNIIANEATVDPLINNDAAVTDDTAELPNPTIEDIPPIHPFVNTSKFQHKRELSSKSDLDLNAYADKRTRVHSNSGAMDEDPFEGWSPRTEGVVMGLEGMLGEGEGNSLDDERVGTVAGVGNGSGNHIGDDEGDLDIDMDT